LTRVNLIYHTEPTTKKWKTEKLKSKKNGYAQKSGESVKLSTEEEKEGYGGKDLRKRKVLSLE